jgi:membrane peptidoglycan carboxypeptidase
MSLDRFLSGGLNRAVCRRLRGRRGRYALAAITVLIAGTTFFLYRFLLAGLPEPSLSKGRLADAREMPGGPGSILITDRHGQLLYEIIDPLGSKHVPLPLAEIPLACQQATVATEDSRFYSHPGVDPVAILRAAWQNWRVRSSAATDGNTAYQIAGASTLTQQLARNLYLSESERTERSLRRKLREAWLAWRLEKVYSKDELLALYLNSTYYGHFAVGIEAAAQAYFGLHAQELDLAQCALLAGLPQYPAGYNPMENPKAARSRQKIVLDLMVRHGYIPQAQADEAGKERLAYASTPFPIQAPHFVMWIQGQLETMLAHSPESASGQGPDAAPALDQFRAGGLRVITTLDLDWQQRAEEIIRRRLAQLRPCQGEQMPPACDPQADPSRRVEDAALVALDPHTGAVLAMVGSPDYFDPKISGAVNAALSLRQPGSAIKPITYAAALDPARARDAGQEPLTAATLIADLRTVFPTAEGRPYVPQNYDRQYHGPVILRMALANSYNIPAVKALQYVGVNALIDQAARLGIPWNLEARSTAGTVQASSILGPSYPVEADRQVPPAVAAPGGTEASGYEQPASGYGLALTLGGGEVRLLDLTAAYGAFANNGVKVSPYAISRIETLDGQLLFAASGEAPSQGVVGNVAQAASQSDAATENPKPAIQSPQSLDPRVAYLITDILSDNNARLPAFGPGNVLEIGRPAAVKTGTTTDWRDNWTIGYTPELVTGVWVGNADNTPMRDISGISGAGPIWHDFMLTVLRDAPSREFSRPDGLVRAEICADSGLLAKASGASVGSGSQATSPPRGDTGPGSSTGNPESIVPCPMRRFEWFIAGTEPTEVDTSHRQLAIDTRTDDVAKEHTPAEFIESRTVWVLPATGEYRAWARDHDLPQPVPVPMAAALALQANPPSAVPDPTLRIAGLPPALTLTSPDRNAVYRLDPGLPAGAQQLPVTAAPGPGLWERAEPGGSTAGIRVTLLLDGRPFASVSDPEYTVWWPLTRGRHTFQAVAARADGSQVNSEPVTVYVQ